jgi:hypothetical protein
MTNQLEVLMEQAAVMRAAGSSWKSIAAALGRDVDTVQHWPQRYPEQWSRYYRAARSDLLGEAYGESITTLRMLMRSEDERSKLGASTVVAKLQHDQDRLEVMQSRTTTRPGGGKQQELSTDGQRIAGILDGMSFEQMQEMAIRVGQALAAANSGKALKPAEPAGGEARSETNANPSNGEG